MWCVRVNDDGTFRFATRDERGDQVAFSEAGWGAVDASAASQFSNRYPPDELERRQLAFMDAVGLGLSDRLKASMRDARARYGGSDVTTSHQSRP